MRLTFTIAIVALLGLSGCATRSAATYETPTRTFARTQEEQKADQQFAVYDPIEGVNRRFYKFNAKFDRYIFIPVTDAYKFIVPDYVDHRFSHFFANLGEFRNATNSALQARPDRALNAVGRFAVNTTVGVLGLYDVATDIGLSPHKEDFGQTLDTWGVGTGAYLVVPVLGPSNVRDTVGFAVDALAFSLIIPNHIEDSVPYMAVEYGLRPVNIRANTDFRYNETGSPFEYELVRYVTTEARRLAVKQ